MGCVVKDSRVIGHDSDYAGALDMAEKSPYYSELCVTFIVTEGLFNHSSLEDYLKQF